MKKPALRYNSWSGHMLGFLARSSVGGVADYQWFSGSLSMEVLKEKARVPLVGMQPKVLNLS